MNTSPWIAQLNSDRPLQKITADHETDIAIIGAGIAGIATTFFLLTKTDKKVTLIEASRIAHGATGHNAGQVTSYFERGFASMVSEFGLSLATHAQKNIENAWILLDEMYTAAGSDIPFSRFLGHAGLSTEAQILLHLSNNFERVRGGLPAEQFLIADHVPFLAFIPGEYRSLYRIVPHVEILTTLETHDPSFIALISFQKGCINSALLCEEVLLWMQKTYPERFVVSEQTPVEKIVLHEDHALLDLGRATVTAAQVVLCTNGFDTVTILDHHGLAIDTTLRHRVEGVVGYMSAYIKESPTEPMAVSYLLSADPNDPYYHPDEKTGDPYFLITRRAYEFEGKTEQSLISVAGPEVKLQDRATYSRDIAYPDAAALAIDRFVKRSYESNIENAIEYKFTWHGLMGYTPNGIRLIGSEPKNPILLYNLGCNGVGILPSVYGGNRIARIISGEKVEETIFDPK